MAEGDNAASKYEFVPLNDSHRELMLRWLALPHVREYWNGFEAPEERLERYLAESKVERYVCRIDGRDAGFIQTYLASDYPPPRGIEWDASTWRIDLFIGEPELLGRGHGGGMLKSFIEILWRRGATRILIDPEPRNKRAIRVYERVGFKRIGVYDEGPSALLFMELNRPAKQ